MRHPLAAAMVLLLFHGGAAAETAPVRGRDLGIPFAFGGPGKNNAITDVPGVLVGHRTLIEGDSVRTGVTVVMPRGKGDDARDPCFGGFFSLNGNGDMTGTHWLEESGFLDGPVAITGTNAVGVVRDELIRYSARRFAVRDDGYPPWSLPLVAETWDGDLSDAYGDHVKAVHLDEAMAAATSGPVAEGGVGGGTGMICYEWKGGIGTASRKLADADGGYTVGVLVQANHGLRHQLIIGGLPMGRELPEGAVRTSDAGSIIIVVATDAPLLANQCKRLARRAALGLARTGAVAGNGSGDLFVAFSTANPGAAAQKGVVSLTMLPNERMGLLFEAVVGATEEAIVNALVAGRTMTGRKGTTVPGLPHDRVKALLARHGLLTGASRD
jgi:L-aminopeptidase/D-esterase-like protein